MLGKNKVFFQKAFWILIPLKEMSKIQQLLETDIKNVLSQKRDKRQKGYTSKFKLALKLCCFQMNEQMSKNNMHHNCGKCFVL